MGPCCYSVHVTLAVVETIKYHICYGCEVQGKGESEFNWMYSYRFNCGKTNRNNFGCPTSSSRQSSLSMISGSAYCALVALIAVSNTPVKLCMYRVLAGLAKSDLQWRQDTWNISMAQKVLEFQLSHRTNRADLKFCLLRLMAYLLSFLGLDWQTTYPKLPAPQGQVALFLSPDQEWSTF